MRVLPPSCLPPLLVLSMALIGAPITAASHARGAWRGHALIQTRGPSLRAGLALGDSQVPLERAEGGDTPVLSFRSPQGPVRLLLDTGAASTMVTSAVAQRLGLSQRRLAPERFSLAGGGVTCAAQSLFSARLPPLQLPGEPGRPGFRLAGAEALVIPGPALPRGVDGVLGAPALRQVPVMVDPVANVLALGPAALRWRQTMVASPRIVPLAWRRGVPLLPLRVRPAAGALPTTLNALADTGAEGVFLTATLAERLTPLHPSQPARLVGVCGLQEARRQHLFGLAIGAEPPPTRSVEAIILTNPVFPLLEVEAIVGQTLLREHHQLWRLDLLPPRLELW
jgi:hypothetical protein